MALHIDIIDLIFENGIAPILFLGAKGLLGLPMEIHLAAIFFGGSMDILIHSVNPYSTIQDLFISVKSRLANPKYFK